MRNRRPKVETQKNVEIRRSTRIASADAHNSANYSNPPANRSTAWPYSSGWGYYPSGGLGLILLIVLILALVGRI